MGLGTRLGCNGGNKETTAIVLIYLQTKNISAASIIILDCPPKCLLIKVLNLKHSPLPGLGNILPFYSQSFSIEVKTESIAISKEVTSNTVFAGL